ncbi:MAG TPA: hypothetical protein VMU09_02680 [Acidimicrobiales bacterium]|nr:hypothetical protein [Acidimicrobiales bacterium]
MTDEQVHDQADDHAAGDQVVGDGDPADQAERAGAKARMGAVDTSTRVNVAFPFSQIRVQEPTKELVELAAVVEGLADLVRRQAPGPEAEALSARAGAVVAGLRRR